MLYTCFLDSAHTRQNCIWAAVALHTYTHRTQAIDRYTSRKVGAVVRNAYRAPQVVRSAGRNLSGCEPQEFCKVNSLQKSFIYSQRSHIRAHTLPSKIDYTIYHVTNPRPLFQYRRDSAFITIRGTILCI